MKVCFLIWLLCIAVGCSVNNSARPTGLNQRSNASSEPSTLISENSKSTVVKNADSKTLDCNNPDGYRLVVVTDPDRDPEKTVTEPQILKIVVGDETKAAVKIPTDSDAQNFVLGSTEKTREGFEITIAYGVRYSYRKQFNFVCKEGNFYLYRVRVESFDDADAKSRANPDIKVIKINPNLPVEKFSIFEELLH